MLYLGRRPCYVDSERCSVTTEHVERREAEREFASCLSNVRYENLATLARFFAPVRRAEGAQREHNSDPPRLTTTQGDYHVTLIPGDGNDFRPRTSTHQNQVSVQKSQSQSSKSSRQPKFPSNGTKWTSLPSSSTEFPPSPKSQSTRLNQTRSRSKVPSRLRSERVMSPSISRYDVPFPSLPTLDLVALFRASRLPTTMSIPSLFAKIPRVNTPVSSTRYAPSSFSLFHADSDPLDRRWRRSVHQAHHASSLRASSALRLRVRLRQQSSPRHRRSQSAHYENVRWHVFEGLS